MSRERIRPIRNSILLMCVQIVTFLCSPATARDGTLIQMSHSCHHVETILHPNSRYVTTKLLSAGGYNNKIILSDRAILTFPTVDVGSMPRTLAWRRAGLCHACQSGNMAILLTSLFFVFTISLLPKYRVNYYDYIV